jgi:hypothetical protein
LTIFDAHQKALKDFRPNMPGNQGKARFPLNPSAIHRMANCCGGTLQLSAPGTIMLQRICSAMHCPA